MQHAALALTSGDPAGVGPMVAARAAVACAAGDRLLVFGDAARLEALLGAERPSTKVRHVEVQHAQQLAPGEIGLVHVASVAETVVAAHGASAAGGRAQLATLDAAIAAVRAGWARALVTAPMCKEAVERSGVHFVGHTEHLARACGLPDDAVTMLFLGPRLKVGLVTTHVSIAAAPREVTAPRVARAIGHLAHALARLDAQVLPRPGTLRPIAITGLNPHAGEGGLFGDEEARAVAPAIEAQRDACQRLGYALQGPLPAETAFRCAAEGQFAGVVAMLHDQATIASKLLDWGAAVNVTWGLPFVRTSVDHGVGYEAARTGTAEADGMIAAVRMAQRLSAAPPAG